MSQFDILQGWQRETHYGGGYYSLLEETWLWNQNHLLKSILGLGTFIVINIIIPHVTYFSLVPIFH